MFQISFGFFKTVLFLGNFFGFILLTCFVTRAEGLTRAYVAGIPKDFPPHFFIDPESGKPSGFGVDVMDAVAKNAGITIKYEIFENWKETFQAARGSRIDIIPNLGITAERKNFIDFTSPYETFHLNLYIRAPSPSIQTTEDAYKSGIGVVTTNKARYVLEKKGKYNLIIVDSFEDLVWKLIAGDVDCIAAPESVMNFLLKKAGIADRVQVLGDPLLEIKRGIGVVKGNKQLVQSLSTALDTYIFSQDYKDVYSKWYGEQEPFRIPLRAAFAGAFFLFVILLTIFIWRFRFITRVNQELEVTVNERTRKIAENEATVRRKLKAITEPRGDLGNLELSDLIDVEAMQQLLDEMYVMTGMCIGVADSKGKILANAGRRDICSRFHRVHPETTQKCIESDTLLSSGVASGEFKLYRCKNNMWEAASPIIVADEHLGNVFFGQFFFDDEKVDVELFRNQAQRYGFDAKEYLTALDNVPRYSRKKVEHSIRFYAQLAGIISSLSYSNIKLSRLIVKHEKAERELRESEMRLHEAQRLAHFGHWNYDPATGETVWSEEIYNILGCDPAKGSPSFSQHPEFIHQDDWQWFETTVRDATELAKPYDIILRVLHPDGSLKFIHSICTPITDEKGQVVELLGTIQDITEQKQGEARLQMVNDALENSLNAFDIVNAEGVFTYVNKAYVQMWGYDSAEEIIGTTPTEHCLDPEQPARIIYALQTTGKFEGEFTAKKKDGSTFEVQMSARLAHDPDGNVIYPSASVDITERRKLIQSLQEQNAYTETIMANMPIGFALNTIDDGEVKFINQRFEEIYGWPQKVFSNIEDFFQKVFPDPDFREEMRTQILADLQSGDPERMQWDNLKIVTSAGEEKYVHAYNIPVLEQNMMISTVQDVTAKKMAEDKIVRASDLLDEAQKIAQLGVFEYIATTKTTVWSEQEYLIYGLDPSGPSPTYDVMLEKSIHPDDAELLHQTFMEAMENNGVYELEHRIVQPDGTVRWVYDRAVPYFDDQGNLLRYIGITLDTTERKQAEESLLRQQRSIKISSKIANVFLTSSRDEVFADVLDVLLNSLESRFGFFGYIDESGDLVCPSLTRDVWDQCQMPGKSIVFSKADWGGLWGQSLTEKRTIIANEGLKIPQGHVALQNAIATPILYNNNLIGQFVLANRAGAYNEEDRDLLESVSVQTGPILFAMLEDSRQKTVHQELENQIRQAQKMEAVGRLAGGVAHDYNNMLSVIIGYSENALESLAEADPLYDDISEILSAGKRSADITRQLLAFARQQTTAPIVLDLNECIEGMLKMLRRLIGEDIDLAWLPGSNLSMVKIDPVQVDQVLANLCVNARDAISDIGKITIETKNIQVSEEYSLHHPESVPGDYVMLAVSDNGAGMSEETVDKIFEPFFTTKGRFEGTGLGLATVHGIIKQNQGIINVYSELGEGTTIKCYLPSHAEGGEKEQLPEDSIPKSGMGETLLLVEDDKSILKLAVKLLTRLGYKVIPVSDPSEAARISADTLDQVDLLITDVVMPKMNGRELSNHLQSLNPRLKTLYMSGYTANVIAHRGVLDEGVSFIQKPLSIRELSYKVRKILDME